MVSRPTRTEGIMDVIRGLIASRALSPGERIPSIRALAASRSVSPSTVVEAYDRLAAEGVIRARPGSGFYVAGPAAPLMLAEMEPAPDREVDPLWVSRQSLDTGAQTLKPGCGWLPAEWLPGAAIRKALRGLARADDALLADYGGARGAVNLRRLLARDMLADGLNPSLDQIMLAATGTQAIDLICRFLLRPGDTVVVDDPCYFNFQALLKVHQAKVVTVPYTPGGPDPAVFAAVLEHSRPRLYITNSALHNPTGATMTPQVAHQVLSAAAEHDVVIVEDDIFAPFEPDPSTRFAALDGLDRVIRIGSFSKTLSASIRCGYIAARADWVEALVDLQVATNFGGPSPMAAEVLFNALSDGGYRKHMDGLNRRLAQARRRVSSRLLDMGLRPWTTPRGGFYLWCALPDGTDATDVARAALAEDVLLAPGDVFSPGRTMAGYMRFNVSQMTDERVLAVLARALAAAPSGRAVR